MPRSDSKLRILVLGHIVRGPLGGTAWHYMQYPLGFARLGHDVCFIEYGGDTEWSCYDPSTGNCGVDPSFGIRFATELFEKFGLGDRWAYHDLHQARWLGPAADRIGEIIATADLLVNVTGANVLGPDLEEVPVRILIDTDPAFTQIQHLSGSLKTSLRHNRFFSFGENIVRPATAIPRDGLAWRATRQPIVLDAWPVTPAPPEGLFTTVMNWDSYKVEEYEGVRYGMKSESFGPYMGLPSQAGNIFEISLGSPRAPRDVFLAAGWKLRNPLESASDAWTYQRYIQGSKAEFTIAKHGYVVSRCGWFSERSAAYLASGRPVITQETGFSDWMQTGCGVVSFQTPEEAVDAVGDVLGHYESHARSARDVAEAYFDSDKVLTTLLEQALAPR